MKTLSVIRGALIALALGASAVPAQAQMGFGFGFGFGGGYDGGGGYYGWDGYYGGYGGYEDDGYRHHHRYYRCVELTDRQIRRSIAARGYHHISLNVRDSRQITVKATRHGRTYLLRVDTCSGTILHRERIRRY